MAVKYTCLQFLIYILYLTVFTISNRCLFYFDSRKAAIVDVRGVWRPHHRSVHTEGVARPGVACGVPQVCGLPSVPRRNMHMLRQGRKNIL